MVFNFKDKIAEIRIDSPQEFSQSSFIITGIRQYCKLHQLEYQFKFTLKPKLGRLITSNSDFNSFPKSPFPKLLYIDVHLISGGTITIGFDLYDLANQFSLNALKNCDVVFKRNFESRYINNLPKDYQEKIRPLGLTFRVYDTLDIPEKVYLSSLAQNSLANLKRDRSVFSRLFTMRKKLKEQVKSIKGQRLIENYESYEKGTENSILFQTRVFPNEYSKDTQHIHSDRYRLIKLLKKEFPNHFKGGFIASRLAKERYSDALTNVPSEPQAYLKAVKAAKIVIYTRGLANSPAWKMAEYLSQGKVIIAEPLTAELPVPLEHGKEVLFFKTDQELVSHIKLVLEDKKLQEHLSRNARLYFEQHVHPLKTIERIFSFTLQHA
jgi:hypothetical protein